MKQAIVSHPGTIVANILTDLGVGVRQFAGNIGVTPATVSVLIGENSPDTSPGYPDSSIRQQPGILAALTGKL